MIQTEIHTVQVKNRSSYRDKNSSCYLVTHLNKKYRYTLCPLLGKELERILEAMICRLSYAVPVYYNLRLFYLFIKHVFLYVFSKQRCIIVSKINVLS